MWVVLVFGGLCALIGAVLLGYGLVRYCLPAPIFGRREVKVARDRRGQVWVDDRGRTAVAIETDSFFVTEPLRRAYYRKLYRAIGVGLFLFLLWAVSHGHLFTALFGRLSMLRGTHRWVASHTWFSIAPLGIGLVVGVFAAVLSWRGSKRKR